MFVMEYSAATHSVRTAAVGMRGKMICSTGNIHMGEYNSYIVCTEYFYYNRIVCLPSATSPLSLSVEYRFIIIYLTQPMHHHSIVTSPSSVDRS